MTEKTFTVAGVSTHQGETKLRFANDTSRVKVLVKNEHTDIDLIELPRAMTKQEIAQYFVEIDFADGRAEVTDAVLELVKKFEPKKKKVKEDEPSFEVLSEPKAEEAATQDSTEVQSIFDEDPALF